MPVYNKYKNIQQARNQVVYGEELLYLKKKLVKLAHTLKLPKKRSIKLNHGLGLRKVLNNLKSLHFISPPQFKFKFNNSNSSPVFVNTAPKTGSNSNNRINSRVRLHSILFLLLILVVSVQSFVLFTLITEDQSSPQVAGAVDSTSAVNSMYSNQSIKSNSRVLQNFEVNKGLIDIGSKIMVNKDSITTRDYQNCQTSAPPPQENGCHFGIVLQDIGLASRGIHLQRLYIEFENNSSGRVKVDIKDYIKSELKQDLGVVDNKTSQNYSILPSRLSPSDVLFFRLWPEGESMTIKSIRIDYMTSTNLNSVALTLAPTLQSAIPKGSIGTLYEDKNKDGLVTLGVDQPWVCKADFAGVRKVLFDQSYSATLLRNHECYTEHIPDSWYIDEGVSALPAGDWLLVFEDLRVVFPFRVEVNEDKAIIELTRSNPL